MPTEQHIAAHRADAWKSSRLPLRFRTKVILNFRTHFDEAGKGLIVPRPISKPIYKPSKATKKATQSQKKRDPTHSKLIGPAGPQRRNTVAQKEPRGPESEEVTPPEHLVFQHPRHCGEDGLIGSGIAASHCEKDIVMATNGFEASRISEGTMHAGAQHVSNLPRPMFDTPVYETPRDPGTKEQLDGHPVFTNETMLPRVVRTANVTGANVHNRDGEKLGTIQDLVIDVRRGRIAYAALSFGGFLGIGDKLFMIPWSALVYDSKTNEFVLDIGREALEKAPGFDKNHWPDMADPVYGTEIHRHYGQMPYWAATPNNHVTDFSSEEFASNRCCE